jgi:hypothetical protein
MAITQTNTMSSKDAAVQIDFASSAFAAAVDICSEVTQVEVDGGEYETSTINRLCGLAPFTYVGNLQPFDVVVTALFTDGETTDLHETLNTNKGEIVWLRWSPKGGSSGNRRFTGSGVLYRVDLPPLDASSSDPITYQFAVLGSFAGENVA